MKTSSCTRLLLGVCLFALSAAATAQTAVTIHIARVYAGPDDSYPLVARLDEDIPVQVMGCLDDWSWCDVAFEDDRGWVYAPDIIYGYEGGYVPLYTYAPSLGIPVVEFTIENYWDRYYHGRPWYGEREEWEHRGPPRHHRPPGPPPSAGQPPRSAWVDRPSHKGQSEGQSDRRLRLGSAEPSHHEAERAGSARDEQRSRKERNENERASVGHPEGYAQPPRREDSQTREGSQRREEPQHRDEPQHREESQSREESQHHQESSRHQQPPRPDETPPHDHPEAMQRPEGLHRVEGSRHDERRQDEKRQHEGIPADRPNDGPR